jgi:hypothetical protein
MSVHHGCNIVSTVAPEIPISKPIYYLGYKGYNLLLVSHTTSPEVLR